MASAVQEEPAVDNIDLISLQISLPNMLDLAIGTPEVGAVNFQILHNFLHILLHQINLQGTKVEYRGENAQRIRTTLASLKSEPSLYLQEYNITDATDRISQRISRVDGIDVDVLTEEKDLKVTKGIKQQLGPEKDVATEKLVFVEPIVDGSTPSALAFKQLEQSVKQLQEQFQALQDLSTNTEVMERLKSRITDPVTDLWQFININKRLEASEQGIDKLTSILQDVMKSDTTLAMIPDIQSFNERLGELESKVSKMGQQFVGLQTIANILTETGLVISDLTDVAPEADSVVDLEATETAITDEAAIPSHKTEAITKKISKAMVDMLVAQRTTADTAGMTEMLDDLTAIKTDTTQMQQELQDLKERVAQIESHLKIQVLETTEILETTEKVDTAKKPVIAETTKDEYKICDAKDNVKQCLEAVQETYGETLRNLTERMDTLERNVGDLMERINNLPAASSTTDDINELMTKMQDIQKDLENLGQTADTLLDDKESRTEHLSTLLEQIEILKTIKADKEYLEDILADKADAQTMNRKVSHERFDATCDILTRGLEEAIDKLTRQELIWQQALDEMQNEVASKVDKIEMTPLKDFVNNRLQLLQEKLKSLIEMKREREAAGTKKLLRDVQCISCDKDVVMKTEEPAAFRYDPLPCTSNIKPYLTYQLDQVRKQQRKLPHGRNMIQFEAAMQETKKIKTAREETLLKSPRDHLCNRYCGGSHTTTTPQQRVLRLRHFLSQWGPEAMQLSDGMIKGKDGQMYRGRPMPAKLDVCGSAYLESQISEESQSQERRSSAQATPRTSVTSRRNSVVSQKRPSKPSRELKPSSQLIEEIPQVTSPKEIEDYSLVTEQQDEIIYDPNNLPEEEQMK